MPRTLGQAVAFLLGLSLAIFLSPFGGKAATSQAATIAETLHRAVNAERVRHHLIPLVRDPQLDAVAHAHSADMARRSYLAHVDPEGVDPLERIQAAGIEGFTLAAENAGRTDEADAPAAILRGWIASPVHARNLYAPPFNRTGIGIAQAPGGAWFVTQLYVTVPR